MRARRAGAGLLVLGVLGALLLFGHRSTISFRPEPPRPDAETPEREPDGLEAG